MANPQKENGYTAIANEIMEQMAKTKLNATQYRILFVVWRYTYGFNRKEHELSLSFLANATGCDKRQLQRELKNLEDKNIIKQNIKNGINRKLQFNKHYKQWGGEIDIGETTIGESDNGESVKATIGESVKATIGESDNQERKLKEIYKESIERFEILWSKYPEKKGKGILFKSPEKLTKLLNKVGFEQLERCIERYRKSKPEWKQWQNGSTFFNSGYIDYLDKNYVESATQQDNLYKEVD